MFKIPLLENNRWLNFVFHFGLAFCYFNRVKMNWNKASAMQDYVRMFLVYCLNSNLQHKKKKKKRTF